MKETMNFSVSEDDLQRFSSADDLRQFYTGLGLNGLELMPLSKDTQDKVNPDMVVGVHLCCASDWMNLDRKMLIDHYRDNLETAREMGAEYVVFHVTQVDPEESFTYKLKHTDEEVIRASADLINELLDGQDYPFWFLMENLWWPGLNFLNPDTTRLLLDLVHYEKKGFMLDTGHFLHTNHDLVNQTEAVAYLHRMLDAQEEMIPYIRGIHLQQSLTGAYVKQWLSEPHTLSDDPGTQMCEVFTHIFAIDKHQPFTDSGVRGLVERINPDYVTYEYITENREQLEEYLKMGKL